VTNFLLALIKGNNYWFCYGCLQSRKKLAIWEEFLSVSEVLEVPKIQLLLRSQYELNFFLKLFLNAAIITSEEKLCHLWSLSLLDYCWQEYAMYLPGNKRKIFSCNCGTHKLLSHKKIFNATFVSEHNQPVRNIDAAVKLLVITKRSWDA